MVNLKQTTQHTTESKTMFTLDEAKTHAQVEANHYGVDFAVYSAPWGVLSVTHCWIMLSKFREQFPGKEPKAIVKPN